MSCRETRKPYERLRLLVMCYYIYASEYSPIEGANDGILVGDLERYEGSNIGLFFIWVFRMRDFSSSDLDRRTKKSKNWYANQVVKFRYTFNVTTYFGWFYQNIHWWWMKKKNVLVKIVNKIWKTASGWTRPCNVYGKVRCLRNQPGQPHATWDASNGSILYSMNTF